jgi:hypothetical protein
MAPVRRLSHEAPLQDGETDVGFRLLPRMLTYVFDVQAQSWETLWVLRGELLKVFKPGSDRIGMRYTFPDARVRQIDCVFADQMSMPLASGEGFSESVAVVLRAPDPTFYDPTEKFTLQQLTGQTQLVFPITFPIQFAGGFINQPFDIGYVGTWRTFPTIEITGPGTNPIIQNLTTGKKLALTYAVASGEVVTINLGVGQKSVVSSINGDKIGTLTDDSDLGDFALLAAPEAVGGTNSMKVTITSGSVGQTSVKIRWYDRFVGV